MPTVKPELVLATWPEHTGCPAYFGDRSPSSGRSISCDSIWLSLRATLPVNADKNLYVPSTVSDAARNIGIWVWINDDGALRTEARLHDVTNMSLNTAEETLKLLRKASKALNGVPMATRSNVGSAFNALSVVLGTIGVKRAIEYRPPVNETFIPVNAALMHVVKEIERRHLAMKHHDGWAAPVRPEALTLAQTQTLSGI